MLSLRNIILKAAILFVAVSFIITLGDPLPTLGRFTFYNSLFPGRPRLPFGENPNEAYNFSLYQLDAMFGSHELASPKPADEFRVVLIGDSSVWGTLLKPNETLAGYLNTKSITSPDGRRLRFYNLGYPTMSLFKDLMVLDRALTYQPDLIIWVMALESFPYDKQLFSPIIQNNPDPARRLITDYNLSFNPNDSAFVQPSFFDKTLLGQRRALADVFRLQLYGVMWAATGIDQFYPATYELRANDLEADPSFHNLQPPHLTRSDLAFEVLEAGYQVAGNVPMLFINEPIFIADGQNSDLRYNFFFPRWAYDDYRTLWADEMEQHNWPHADFWNLVAPSEFTNSAVHLTPTGSAQLADAVNAEVEKLLAGK